MPDRDGVQSVVRALSLLRLMAQGEGGTRLSDLARAAGLPVSTAHRLLTTLEQQGFAQFDPPSSAWHVGRDAFSTGMAYGLRLSFVADQRRPGCLLSCDNEGLYWTPQLPREAEAALRQLFDPTPLQRNDHLSARYDADIWLKREDLTPVRSYKLRGAFNAMRHAGADPGARFVCASAGNHAQGVAFACRHFGARGVIFMPVTTPRQKIDKTRMFGAGAVEIVLTGDYFDQTLKAAQDYSAAHGAVFLSPFDDARVIEGQATVAAEMLAQIDAPPDLVVLPVGGGGLAAGVTEYCALSAPQTGFAFVEPAGGAGLAVDGGELLAGAAPGGPGQRLGALDR